MPYTYAYFPAVPAMLCARRGQRGQHGQRGQRVGSFRFSQCLRLGGDLSPGRALKAPRRHGGTCHKRPPAAGGWARAPGARSTFSKVQSNTPDQHPQIKQIKRIRGIELNIASVAPV